MNKQAMIEKLERSAASERALGNHDAASTFEAKAKRLRLKFNLPAPEPVGEQVKPTVQQRTNYWDNFPGVAPTEKPLTNEQLQALRDAAAGGRPLSDAECARVLGQKYEAPSKHKDNIHYI